ncbi:DedA family protein [Frondihabitans sp. PAMC 28766]|uniref:DedA family protein n=1 Tax=Frondihabitans sp. PAMC 28766 TaxID=1795630 RepID=UPI0009E9C956|nr:DedA family protein [Frondihabitans sp. PAMC 28766]
MDAVNASIVSLAGSPWVLVIVLLLVVVDGFFPPVPSESVVVALAAVGFATGLPNPWLVLVVAALGSFLGDNIAFLIGRSVGLDRFRWLRGRRISALREKARSNLERKPAAVILTARFIPVGRVVVNVLAGANGFSRRRFVALTAVSGVAWAAYSILIGIVAGSWIHDNPLLGIGIAVGMALVVGVLVDTVGRWLSRRRAAPATSAAERPAAPPADQLASDTNGETPHPVLEDARIAS